MHHRTLLNFHCPPRAPHTLEMRWPRSHGLSCSLMMKSFYSHTLFSVLKHLSISRWNSVANDKREAIKDGLGQLFLPESVHKNRRSQFFWNNVLWFFFICQVSSAEQVYPGPEQCWPCHHEFPPALLKSCYRWPSIYAFPVMTCQFSGKRSMLRRGQILLMFPFDPSCLSLYFKRRGYRSII